MQGYEVWYMRPDFFRDGMMGVEWLRKEGLTPDPAALEKTHVLLKGFVAGDREEIYAGMQGERWSPNGEARELIESLGLRHTSMSVGDILRETDSKRCWMVDRFGFEDIGG